MKILILLSLFLYLELILSISLQNVYKNKHEFKKNTLRSKSSKSKDFIKTSSKYRILSFQNIFYRIIFNEELDKDIANEINNLYWIFL